jgi:hypothetical protein
MVKRSHDDPEDDVVNDDDDGMEEEDDGEDDDVDDDNDRRRRKKSKKKKKVLIMGESKQTDADRRLLRRKQRELHNDIALGGDAAAAASAGGQIGGGEGGGDDDSLRRLRALNNELWQDVRYTREAVLDSENVDLIASKAARQAEKIVQVSSCFLLLYGVGTGVVCFSLTHKKLLSLFVQKYDENRFPATTRFVWPRLLSRRALFAQVRRPSSIGVALAFRWVYASTLSHRMYPFYMGPLMQSMHPRNGKKPNVRRRCKRLKLMTKRTNSQRMLIRGRRKVVMGMNCRRFKSTLLS